MKTTEASNKRPSKKNRKDHFRHKHAVSASVADEEDGTQVEDNKTIEKNQLKSLEKRRPQLDSQASLIHLRKFCLETLETSVQGLARQFLKIKFRTQVCFTKTAFIANVSRNRYKDVPCTDKNRVILRWPNGTNDYIHANYVDFWGEKKFICTQAPMENTVDDFWRLIWQEKCKAIVMLCEIIEQNRKKCEPYWPLAAGRSFVTKPSGLLIRNLNVLTVEATITISILEVCWGHEKRLIRHVKWNNWPDRGVPEQKLAPLRLLGKISGFEPVVIHCSAGIGRTGTIVGLYMALQVLQAGKTLSLFDVVNELRSSRHGSVQTDVQYVYMHRTLLAIGENKKLIQADDLEKFDIDYNAFVKIR